MGRAVGELDKVSTTAALPHEMEALNYLLKAIADARRREVTRSQQAGGGGGSNRSEADLSTLFDQELRKRQSTNYETPNSTEQRQDDNQQDDLLERIRELARRQDALNRQQRDLARNRDQLEEAELKRQLERLTREQNELRQQAEQLAQRMQQQGPGQRSQNGESSGQSSGQSGGASKASRTAGSSAKRPRTCATPRRDAPAGFAAGRQQRLARLERLRELERQIQTAKPDDRRRALGDLQLETRQLADAQRRLNNEAGRTDSGASGDDARRRLAGEQERLADRADRLQDQVKRMSRAGQSGGDERKATDDAARELERQKLADRMRQSAEALRQSGAGANDQTAAPPDASKQVARQGEEVARALDRIADRLGAATGTQDRDSRRLSDQLSKAQELRDKLAELERSVEELKRQDAQGQQESEAANGNPRDAQGQSSSERERPAAGAASGSAAGAGQPGRSTAGSQSSANGRDGATGQQGAPAARGRVQQLQREVNDSMRDAARLADEMRRDNPGMQSPNPNDGWWRSSAPGTEAFKQDFARWESLKKNLLVALEGVETKVSSELRTRENKERLNAGGHNAVSDAYREQVEKHAPLLSLHRENQSRVPTGARVPKVPGCWCLGCRKSVHGVLDMALALDAASSSTRPGSSVR